MNALRTRPRPNASPGVAAVGSRTAVIDWATQIKLALVLSAITVIAAVALAGRVSEPALVIGTIVIASAVAWARVEPAARPARMPVRHR